MEGLLDELVKIGILERVGDGYRVRVDFLEQLLYAIPRFVESFVSDPVELRKALVDEEELRKLFTEICMLMIIARSGRRTFREDYLLMLGGVLEKIFMDIYPDITASLLEILRRSIESKLRSLRDG